MSLRDQFTPEVRRAIYQRKPFKTHFLVGYRTAGGTYMIASTGVQNDVPGRRDLLAVQTFAPTVFLLNPTTAPELPQIVHTILTEGELP